MMGTALVALALGPWWGALTGVLSGIINDLWLQELLKWKNMADFTVVNLAGALLWGYLGRKPLRLVGMNIGENAMFQNILILGIASGLILGLIPMVIKSALFVWYVPNIGNLWTELVWAIPDKVVSVAVAILIIYTFFKLHAGQFEHAQDKIRIYADRLAIGLFGIAYLAAATLVLSRGNYGVRPVFDVLVVMLWLLPLVVATGALVWRTVQVRRMEAGDREPENQGDPGQQFKDVDTRLVYDELIALLGAIYVIFSIWYPPSVPGGLAEAVAATAGFLALPHVAVSTWLRLSPGSYVQ